MNLVPLYEQAIQFNNYNGTVLAAGKVEVWYLGRTRKADIYADVAGETPLPNPFDLNDLGMQEVYVNPAFNYTLVVCDPYGAELFSVDKYLQGAGGHTTSNVVVQPSESIAVSAWTVGEVQIYQPYLTGQLGKVYTGIEPIVVNNVEDKISANHVPLGVQDPLYFVQDDEEGCIIGFSGETLPEGTMNESAFGYEDGQITSYNGSAFSAGNSYEAGNYISIDNNTLSVTGLTPVPADTASTGLVASVSADITAMIPDTSDMATQTWVNEQGFLTAHQDLSDYAKTEDLTAYQPVGDYYSASNPSGFINSDAISAMATTGFVADVSADITAMIPSTAGLATEDWVSSQGYLTAHQSLDGLMSADLLEIADNKITGYNGTAFAGQGGVSGDYELSAGSGISIVDYPLEQKTVISVTAQGGNPEVEQAVIDNSATWNTVSDKLNTTAFSDVSGTFLTAHQDLSDYQPITGMTAYQAAGDYLTANALDELSGNWETVTAKLDTTAFSDVSGTFLTAHQDISNKLDTTAFSDVSGSFLTAVPDTYLQNTDLATSDGKVTAISGIPLSAGSDVPEGVMVESGLEYNAVNEISAYNGSAIAQYGAEKQWLQHDDTIVHVANSAQYAFGVNLSAVAQLLGVDETVLYDDSVGIASSGSTAQLSESLNNFKFVDFYYQGTYRPNPIITRFEVNSDITAGFRNSIVSVDGGSTYNWVSNITSNNTTLGFTRSVMFTQTWTGTSRTVSNPSTTGSTQCGLVKVVGIGRKEV